MTKELKKVNGEDVPEKVVKVDVDNVFRETGKTLLTINFNKEEYGKVLAQLKSIDATKLGVMKKKDLVESITLLEAAIGWEVPACGVTLLFGNPYMNTSGLLYKVRSSEKFGKLTRISAEPMKDKDGNPFIASEIGKPAIFVGTVEFEEATFQDIGEAGAASLKAKEFIPFANSMAARRATNRAMRLAVDWGATSFEELPEANNGKREEGGELLTEKEMGEIMELVAELESVKTPEDLASVKTKLTEKKESLSKNQVLYLARLYKKQEMVFGAF
jgi:hypothetical protein